MMATFALIIACALFAADGPLVFDVPSGSAPPGAQRDVLFLAAPFEVRGGRFRRGAWTSSDEILPDGWTRVIVVASWCPGCRNLLERLSADRPSRTVVLFLEEENDLLLEHAVRERKVTREQARLAREAHRGQPLRDAAMLEGFPLPLYLMRSGSALARQVTQYPFTFMCSRARCTPERARASR